MAKYSEYLKLAKAYNYLRFFYLFFIKKYVISLDLGVPYTLYTIFKQANIFV